MKNLTIKNIVNACGGTFFGDETLAKTEISAVTADSRDIKSGCLFAAIKGEKADGHTFVKAALQSGAICAICEYLPEDVQGGVILVRSTLAALQELAKLYRSGFAIPFVGITGSVGKTTTKEMVASVLSQRHNVHKTKGNFNNELGVPITIFGLSQENTAAVIEMGISGFGEMRRLAEMVRPQFAIFTAIGSSHLEQLHDLQGVLRAKSEMFEGMPEDGIVFLNGDDEILGGLQLRQKTVLFGLGEDNAVRATGIKSSKDGITTCEIACRNRKIAVTIPAYGNHMVYAALAAASVAFEMGLTDDEIRSGIARYVGVVGRASLLKSGNITIIDDCYNSNPTSAKSALVSLKTLEDRKIAILGDMLELGENAHNLHFEIGAYARACGVSRLLTSGEFAKAYAGGAGNIAECFDSKQKLIESLKKEIKPGDNVLVKASHGAAYEDIVQALKSLEI